jgi:hypothetical protein
MEVFGMHDVKEDSETRRYQFGFYWKTQLHEWLADRKSVAGAGIGDVLLRLNEFSKLVRDETFEVASERTLSEQVPAGVLELNGKLADRFCRGLRGTERLIARKAVQEAFLYATGVEYDLPLSAFGRKFAAFLKQRGSKGLSVLFLRSLVFNELSMSLEIPLQSRAPDIRALEGAFHELDRLCLAAVDTAFDEHSTWPKLNRRLARNLIHALDSQTGRVVRHSVA